jgi:hypothetical protein
MPRHDPYHRVKTRRGRLRVIAETGHDEDLPAEYLRDTRRPRLAIPTPPRPTVTKEQSA